MRRLPHFGSLRLLLGSVSTFIALLVLLLATPVAQASAHFPLTGFQVSLVHSHPLLNKAVRISGNASAGLLPCLNATKLPLCYSPQQIRRAYGVDKLLAKGYTGKGRTIVIVDTFQDPTIVSDLKLFDKIFSLPDPPALNIIAPYGLKPFSFNDPGAVGFAAEIALDVEWSHIIAPDATIDLVLGNPASDGFHDQIDSVVLATKYAVDNNLGSTLSQSFGAGESCFTASEKQLERETFDKARAEHISTFASAGDSGSASVACDTNANPVAIIQGVEYPASDPLVTGVGGTTLFATRSGKYVNETVWNESTLGAGATGGGFSTTFARPSYQDGVPGIGNYRGVPDVAYNADPLTGVPIVISSYLPGATLILPIGGTSAGSPQWAALTALIDQAAGKRLGFLNGDLYRILKSDTYGSAFHDITVGNNAFTYNDGKNNVTVPGYSATTGWDPTTGVGSPKAYGLVNALVKCYNSNDGANL